MRPRGWFQISRWTTVDRAHPTTNRTGSPAITRIRVVWRLSGAPVFRSASASRLHVHHRTLTTRPRADAAARCAEQSLAGLPETKARRRAIGYVLLATAQVQQREIEQACNTGLKAVELLETLRSNRGADYLEDFQQRLEPYREEPVVREFGARLELQAAA